MGLHRAISLAQSAGINQNKSNQSTNQSTIEFIKFLSNSSQLYEFDV